MTPSPTSLPAAGPRRQRLLAALAASGVLHAGLALLIAFDVIGAGGGFGLGVGAGFGIGAGGGAGAGEKRREIFSLRDLPTPVPPTDPAAEETLAALLRPATAEAIAVPRRRVPRPKSSPVVRFSPPARPLGSSVDLGSRLAAAGAGVGGLGGGGGGGIGWSLGGAFRKYVGSLRQVGLDVALVIDATGSMQPVIDEMKGRLDDLARTMQRLVPTARIGAVTFRDRDGRGTADAPRRSEDFLVRWTDLTFNGRKVQTFLSGIVAEGGGDWEEAVKDGLQTAVRQFKWRANSKKVIILVGSSPPHAEDQQSIKRLIAGWRGLGGVVSTIDVSQLLHESHERKVYKWLHDEELVEVSPLPEFYAELQESFTRIAKEGGGQMLALGENGALVRHLLLLAFGPEWEKDVARIARGL